RLFFERYRQSRVISAALLHPLTCRLAVRERLALDLARGRHHVVTVPAQREIRADMQMRDTRKRHDGGARFLGEPVAERLLQTFERIELQPLHIRLCVREVLILAEPGTD